MQSKNHISFKMKQKITITIDKEFIKIVDKLCTNNTFTFRNRSHFVEIAIHEKLKREKKIK